MDLADANCIFNEGVFLVSGLEEVEIVAQGGEVQVVLQHDDIQLVEDFIRVLGRRVWREKTREGTSASECHGKSTVGGYDESDEDGRHKEDNIISVEKATVVRILTVVPSISAVSATGVRKAYLSGILPEWPRLREVRLAEMSNGERCWWVATS